MLYEGHATNRIAAQRNHGIQLVDAGVGKG